MEVVITLPMVEVYFSLVTPSAQRWSAVLLKPTDGSSYSSCGAEVGPAPQFPASAIGLSSAGRGLTRVISSQKPFVKTRKKENERNKKKMKKCNQAPLFPPAAIRGLTTGQWPELKVVRDREMRKKWGKEKLKKWAVPQFPAAVVHLFHSRGWVADQGATL